MKIFGIAGFKDSGKTTLVVDLVRELAGRGLRVATVKHAHHEFDIDQPGKDSYRHREAGAEEVIVASAKRWAHIRELTDRDEPPLDELVGRLGDIDVVLIEGYKYGSHPKLEVRRAGLGHPPLAPESDTIRGIVSEGAGEGEGEGVPLLARDDVPAIADFILAADDPAR